MQNENSYTVSQWCDRWFHENQSRWNSNTVGGYRNLIYATSSPESGISGCQSCQKAPSPASITAFRTRDSAPEVSGASICSCGAAWTRRPVTSAFLTTRCGSAGNHKQKHIKQPLCAWGSSSGI